MFIRKKLRIYRDYSRNLEPHEVFLDRLAQQKESEIPESENKLERPLPRHKFWLLLSGVFFFFSILIGRSFWFQIVKGQEYYTRSENNQFIVSTIRAERGIIYDRFMNQLVYNQTIHQLVLDINKIPEDNAQQIWLMRRLSEFTGITVDELENKIIENNADKIILQNELAYDQIIFWETKSENWPGVYVERQLIRRYQEEGGLSHILGYISRIDRVGVAGLEKQYDDYLRDRAGQYQIERDARGRILEDSIIQEPKPGDSLVLNIDFELQKIIENALRNKMEAVGSHEANAVALDPRNGAVLSIVSIPGYDNNLFMRSLSSEEIKEKEEDPSFSFFNQAISGIGYATGSVIKPLIGVAALEEEIIDPDRQIFAAEEICIPHAYTGEQQCFRDWSFHGMTDLRRAIAESVNTYFYTIGGGHQNIQGLGPEKIKIWLERFGWGDPTGIDLPNEGQGILPNIDQNWRLGHTYHLSIGQGAFSITPLQVAVAYSVLANGGILYQPQVVKQIIHQGDDQEKNIEEISPIIVNPSVADYKNIQIIREGMRRAVTDPRASAYALNSLSVTSAAKTGTAQTGQDRVYHNWIALFAPYDNPEIVLVLMIRDVKESMVAVRSVAYEILDLYFNNKNDKFNQDDL